MIATRSRGAEPSDGCTVRICPNRLLLARRRLFCDQIAEMHRVENVGFDDADKTFSHIDGVVDAEVPEIGVEPVSSRCQDRRLRSALAAVNEEIFGVEHVQLMPRRKGVGEKLVGAQRRAVLCIQETILAHLLIRIYLPTPRRAFQQLE